MYIAQNICTAQTQAQTNNCIYETNNQRFLCPKQTPSSLYIDIVYPGSTLTALDIWTFSCQALIIPSPTRPFQRLARWPNVYSTVCVLRGICMPIAIEGSVKSLLADASILESCCIPALCWIRWLVIWMRLGARPFFGMYIMRSMGLRVELLCEPLGLPCSTLVAIKDISIRVGATR